jgi:hypothetical protein
MRVKLQRSVVLIVDLTVGVIISVSHNLVVHEPSFGRKMSLCFGSSRLGSKSPSSATRRCVLGFLETISSVNCILISCSFELVLMVSHSSSLSLERTVHQISNRTTFFRQVISKVACFEDTKSILILQGITINTRFTFVSVCQELDTLVGHIHASDTHGRSSTATSTSLRIDGCDPRLILCKVLIDNLFGSCRVSSSACPVDGIFSSDLFSKTRFFTETMFSITVRVNGRPTTNCSVRALDT